MSEEQKKSFSEEQESAINANGCNYLISAGAGSGKTAVLTERIYRLAKKQKTLDNFLVLTFTNLAAGEMKSRVRKKLLEDPEISYLANEVDNSHIETFDAFSQFVVKKYFYRLGISKSFNLVEQTTFDLKRQNVIDEVVEELCLKDEPLFKEMLIKFTTKDDRIIMDIIKLLLEKGDKQADNYAFYNHIRNDYYTPQLLEEVINNLYQDYLKATKEIVNLFKEIENEGSDVSSYLDMFEPIIDCNNYDEVYSLLQQIKLNMNSLRKADKEKKDQIRNLFDNKLALTGKKGKDFGDSKFIKETYFKNKEFVQLLCDIVIEVERRLDAFKKEHNAYTFIDISRFLLVLLKENDIKEELKKQFDFIMVDEYQDTNDIQEAVIQAISKNNIYMVGDVKQSIYRFRGADPTIFQQKHALYKDENGGKEIALNRSYRSREEIVNFINDVFSTLMNVEDNPIDYEHGHIFEYGQKDYLKDKPNQNFLPEIYPYEMKKSDENAKEEAEIVCQDILTRMKNGYQVYDFSLKKHRKCDFKDFAVIIDRGTNFGLYRKTFEEYGIPLKVFAKEELFKSDVIMVAKSLVQMLRYALCSEYNVEYKHAFVSVARSFLFQYDDKKIYDICNKDQFLNDPLAHKIELMKGSLMFSSLKEIMLTLYEEFDIYSKVSLVGEYYANVHKLEYLLKIAEGMDTLSYTFEEYADYFINLNKNDLDIDYSDNAASDNAATLINIHGSKGLEYPIIYYSGLTKEFNRPELKNKYSISEKYGLVLPNTGTSLISPFALSAKTELKKADYEEKLRLLYVAFTRAKEKIVILKPEKSEVVKDHYEIKSFNAILDLIEDNIYGKYLVSERLIDYEKQVKPEKQSDIKIHLDEINVPFEEVVKMKASKEAKDDVDEGLLEFGTLVHYYLENMDLDNDDLSGVDKRFRKYVSNVKNSILFKGISNSMVRHEFPFYDEENHSYGYIDALIIKDDEVDIIDFKLKNIDDDAYDKQLRTYKKYVSKHINKPIKMYLLAAINGEMREVKDND